jgi:hypothetical protein
MKKFIEAGRTSSNIDEILETGNTYVSEHVAVHEARNKQIAHILRTG